MKKYVAENATKNGRIRMRARLLIELPALIGILTFVIWMHIFAYYELFLERYVPDVFAASACIMCLGIGGTFCARWAIAETQSELKWW